jgi:hypothetical protein
MSTKWQTVENFVVSIEYTLLKTLKDWLLVCEDCAYFLYSFCVQMILFETFSGCLE